MVSNYSNIKLYSIKKEIQLNNKNKIYNYIYNENMCIYFTSTRYNATLVF